MFETLTHRFLDALEAVLAQPGEQEYGLSACVRAAIKTPTPERVARVQDKIRELPEADRDRLMQKVHHHMATDLSAIWDQMPNASPGGRPN
ncbi:hypothetical protein Q5Y75_26620 [Ruegeria sp. 2205SS24-7]|uniref:hypothetical protein n=1 Tax=Ruegeria discodermiae TaxID=3064389 RepID=UPI0027403C17|nr:hypothetical protein [Ruegeria sp. 2205SS24-7]MDP5220767.1 hypothetical protein [Ruegeria sp. 2205SS24-7]